MGPKGMILMLKFSFVLSPGRPSNLACIHSELSGQGRDSLQCIGVRAITTVPGIHSQPDLFKWSMLHIRAVVILAHQIRDYLHYPLRQPVLGLIIGQNPAEPVGKLFYAHKTKLIATHKPPFLPAMYLPRQQGTNLS